MTSVLNRNIL